MSYRYHNGRRIPEELKIAMWIVGIALLFVGLVWLMVWGGTTNARERDCFEAGGRIVDSVCMQVDGAIKLPRKES